MANVVIFTGTSRTTPAAINHPVDVVPQVLARPLGAYQIASLLRDEGYTVQIVDRYHWIVQYRPEQWKKICEKYIDSDTLWVGWSNTFFESNKLKKSGIIQPYDHPIAESLGMNKDQFKFIKEFKNKYPKLQFVCGGAKTWRWSQEPSFKFFDYFVEGYADEMAKDLTNHIANLPNNLKVSRTNKDGSHVLNYDKKGHAFDFVNHKHKWHVDDKIQSGESLPIEVARGCVFRCAYCSYPLNGKNKNDFLKRADILRESLIENYETYGVKNYVYSDDTHNDSVEKLEYLYNEVYSKLPFKINFSTYTRLDLLSAHPHTAELLHASGLTGTFFGIESFNQQANKMIGKSATTEKLHENLHRIKAIWKDDVAITMGLIFGLPNDDEQTIRSWMEPLLQENNIADWLVIAQLHLFPAHGADPHWMNKMELNPEFFGYTFDSDDIWTNNKGFNKYDADRLKKEMDKRLPEVYLKDKKNIWGWITPQLVSAMGIDKQTYQTSDRDYLIKLRDQILDKYVEALLS